MPIPSDNMLFGFAEKLTQEQREYVDSIFDNQLTIVNAKSGTGKTTLAVACAAILGKPLIYTFAPVEEGKMGFRPGSQAEKESQYCQPLIDALLEIGENPLKALHQPDDFEQQKRGDAWVTAKSHVFMRGTNIKDSTLIIDESQNMTRGDIKKILSRCHDTTTVIMIGHDAQCDLKDASKSGFVPYMEHFRDKPYAKVVDLTINFRGQLAQDADELEW